MITGRKYVNSKTRITVDSQTDNGSYIVSIVFSVEDDPSDNSIFP